VAYYEPDNSLLLTGMTFFTGTSDFTIYGNRPFSNCHHSGSCAFWLKINSTHAFGKGEDELIIGNRFISIAPYPLDPNFVIMAGYCDTHCNGIHLSGVLIGSSVENYIARYDINSGLLVSVVPFGVHALINSMTVTCSHIFVSGTFQDTSGSVSLDSVSVTANSNAGDPGLFIAKFLANMTSAVWIQRITTGGISPYASCTIAPDYNGGNYSVACNHVGQLQFDSGPSYSLPGGGFYVFTGTDPANQCPGKSSEYNGSGSSNSSVIDCPSCCKCDVRTVLKGIRDIPNADGFLARLLPFT